MGKKFTVSHHDDHVRIDTELEHNLDYAVALWTKVSKACEKNGCYRVLGVSNAPEPMPTMDGFAHADLFRDLNIDARYRIAWVELNEDARAATHFVETVLSNRGLPGKLFETESEASTWLFQSSAN